MNRLPEESSLQTDAAGSSSPDAFGPFRVLHQIGAGTLGPVFRAYEPERDRLVAIKLFRLDLPPERVHQLVGEFEHLIAAELSHPTIAAPLAAGIDGVTAYLAQEYVSAESLDVVIREKGPLPVAEALGVAAKLAEALDAAADRHVVHGALHPRDVLHSPDELRLVGLGVTRALERAGVAAPVRRPYTAPERIGGGAWDRRADVFSLAAVMHEAIWGKRLSGAGAHAASAISDAAGGNVTALRDTFACALADDIADRFATASAFAEALEEAFASKPSKVSRMVRRPRPAAESRLPLDDADEAADVALRSPEPPRFREIEADADAGEDVEAVAPALLGAASMADTVEPLKGERREPFASSLFGSAADGGTREPVDAAEPASSLTLVWPLALAGLVGAALGFGAGYAVAIRDRPVAVASAPAPAGPAGPETNAPPVVRELGAGAVESRPLPPIIAPIASAPAPAAPVQPRAAVPVAPLFAGRVLVRSTPPGARVFVDGKSGGETPSTVRELARGPHQVRVVHEGYTTVERRIVITATQSAQTLTIPMVKAPAPAPAAPARTEAPLVVESRPPGAAVFLDDRPVGATPLTFPVVQVGAHSIRIVLEGYRPWSASVQVSGSEANRVTASLER